MALLNPAYLIVLPFLFICTIPFAILASLTTFIAFSILFIRVVLVYIELALAIIPYYLLGTSYSKLLQQEPPSSPATARRRKRRSSVSSNLSGTGTITPLSGDYSAYGLSQSVGSARDFEGVGGWRLDNPSDDDGLWTNINVRLELPADHGRRHHRRSATSGSMSGDGRVERAFGPESTMNTSKARTPPSSAFGGGEYFPQGVGASKGLRRSNSGVTGLSGSSGSSKGSSILTMKQR